MKVECSCCGRTFDDAQCSTICPHDKFQRKSTRSISLSACSVSASVLHTCRLARWIRA